jgi:hypothetical protein
MNVKYKNRAGKIYYLHIGKTKKDNVKYFFSSKKDGDLAESIPNGYEIYENVNAQVFLRKIQPKIIRDEELKIIAQEIQKHPNPHRYKYDVKKNIITVYDINQDIERRSDFFQFAEEAKVEKYLLENATYSPIMRFILEDEEKRLFVTERFCFLGSIDNWIYIGGPDSLNQETKKFIKHLGEESFFEL